MIRCVKRQCALWNRRKKNLRPNCRVSPFIRTSPINYALLGGTRKRLKSKTTGKINRQTNLDRYGPRPIANVWHPSRPSFFLIIDYHKAGRFTQANHHRCLFMLPTYFSESSHVCTWLCNCIADPESLSRIPDQTKKRELHTPISKSLINR
jgi:hypothetical protein